MDQRKLVAIIKQHPQVWDRSQPYFRDKEFKQKVWQEIGTKIGFAGEVCRETFKKIREKYIREREKNPQYYGEHYHEWELLPELNFLDPHIFPRRNAGPHNPEDALNASKTAQIIYKEILSEDYKMPIDSPATSHSSDSLPTDFDRRLIAIVRKAAPIWDRNCNAHPNKHMKDQLWQMISQKLNRDPNACMLRWKALREKYIRQKTKYEEGEAKWELLDDMSFLDKVIQYRKKPHIDFSRLGYHNGSYMHPNESIGQENDYETFQYSYDTDSSNDFIAIVKQESCAVQQVADSSYNTVEAVYPPRKRTSSCNSGDTSPGKIFRPEDGANDDNKPKCDRSPEQLFGDLVAAMLSKKQEKDRNMYMIEIMTVLSK